MNRNSDETYKVVFGDKDTFLIGFLQTQADFLINPHPCSSFRGGLLQKDLQGEPLFTHLTGAKFQRHGRLLVNDAVLPGGTRAIEITHDLLVRKII